MLWWTKAVLILLATVFGVMFATPTFLGDPSTWPTHETGDQKGEFVHWHHKLAKAVFPESRINLGLDLKGGLHLLFEVEVERSVHDAVSRAMLRAQDVAKEKGIVVNKVTVNDDNSVLFEMADPAKKAELSKIITEQSYLVLPDDLKGNVLHVSPNVIRVDEFRKQVLSQAINTIRNRIDQFGVAEPNIFQQGDKRIVVQMPGMQDIERAKQLIGNTAQLDFRRVLGDKTSSELDEILKEGRKTFSLAEDDTKIESIRKISTWAREQKKIPEASTIILQRVFESQAGVTKMTGSVPYLLDAQAKLTGDLLESAQAITSQQNFIPETVVEMKFIPQGAKLFGDLTKEASDPKNTPNQIAIVLDDNINSAPSVNGPILGGSAIITLGRRGSGTEAQLKEAQDLALVLRSGALPAKVTVIEERQVGPSEGEENIRKGVISSTISGLIVILFMVYVYGTSGVVANVAMLLNVVLILSFMAAFGATLTLPGIAGIVLTMAVAVDGNVIINERIREEVRSGLPLKAAFYRGYTASFGTLIDAHITSAVAGFVLLIYGNPAVKGFAVTLMMGIIATLFTSYYVTEVIGQWLVEKTKVRRFM